jgi:hypothetical protein
MTTPNVIESMIQCCDDPIQDEKEIGYDIEKGVKEWFCGHCGGLCHTRKISKEEWNKENPEMQI